MRNPGSTARASAGGETRRHASARAVSAAAPAAATQTGAMPTSELSANPPSVSVSTASARRGNGRGAAGRTASRGRPRSIAKKRVSTTHSTPTAAIVGSAISAAKRANDSPLA
jgi:hypothetical protein